VRFLVTGSAGFIGFHVAQRLIAAGHDVAGIDGMTAYYDEGLKRARHALLLKFPQFSAHQVMLEDFERLRRVYQDHRPEVIIHLAAQAGVRYSIENPRAYIDANLVGTFNILELARAAPPRHLLLASTSSVYGANSKMPFAESDPADRPVSLYAATKKSTEAMAHAYAHLFNVPTTVFRFFTAYGPWGRPDMAYFKFTKAVIEGRPIDVYNHGEMERDFTYVDDLGHAIILLVDAVPNVAEPGASTVAPYRVINIGNGTPVRLDDFIAAIEASVGKSALRNELPMQPGDVRATWADTSLLQQLTGFQPETPINIGVARFVAWYREYYKV